MVEHNKHLMNFQFWDTETAEILKTTAQNLIDKMKEVSHSVLQNYTTFL